MLATIRSLLFPMAALAILIGLGFEARGYRFGGGALVLSGVALSALSLILGGDRQERVGADQEGRLTRPVAFGLAVGIMIAAVLLGWLTFNSRASSGWMTMWFLVALAAMVVLVLLRFLLRRRLRTRR